MNFDPSLNAKQLALQLQRELIEEQGIDSEIFFEELPEAELAVVIARDFENKLESLPALVVKVPTLTFRFLTRIRKAYVIKEQTGSFRVAIFTQDPIDSFTPRRVAVRSIDTFHAFFQRPGVR